MSFPRSKYTPDFYITVITVYMRRSPEEQKILSMGSRRVSVSKGDEGIVAAQIQIEGGCSGIGRGERGGNGDEDIAHGYDTMSCRITMDVGGMGLSESWTIMLGGKDWEMVNCST